MALLNTRKGDLLILAVVGKLDGFVCDQVEREFEAVIDGKEKFVLFDLSEMDYLSSSGLRLFIIWGKKLSAQGAMVHYAEMKTAVKEVFAVSGLGLRMKIFPTFDEALKAFRRK